VANLVPEIDQIKIGTYLVPAADRIIDVAASRRIRDVTMAVYRPMEVDPEYRALGSVMSYAYADEDSGHLYEYVPARAPDERLPLFVFLHGSAGNFKAYAWVLRAFADRARVIVVCPSFGFGNWYDDGGVAAVERARAYGVAQLGADPRRVVLAGLSNGGTGVTRAAAASPEAYAGLVFFSAVLEPEVLAMTDFARAASGKPVLLVHGARDDRIDQRWPDLAAARLRDLGATVTYRLYPEEDHFLFFARKDDVLEDLARWLASTPVAVK
jgi:predicted esterase